MINKRELFYFIYVLLLLFSLDFHLYGITISKNYLNFIGYKIYQNECGSDPNNLTHWNKGENFASMGIGHFIWYPANSKKLHQATFPKLIEFLLKHNVRIPRWLRKSYNICPWPNREVFYKNFYSAKMIELRELLKRTIHLQTLFIVKRFNSKIPELLHAAERAGTREKVEREIYRMLKTPFGLYALIDYSNFKGMGTLKNARWGLLQVLENMEGSKIGRIALYDFANSASKVLWKRVQRSKNRKQEEKWYIGWLKRLKGYYLIK